jgi:FtsH-binding integral membrane protein
MMIAARHNIEAVLLTLVITTISCGGIIIFSMTTKIDFTK